MLNGPPEPKKHCFWPKNGIFRPFLGKKWPLFDTKMAIFRGGGALHHPFSGSLILQHMFL